jgi:5-methylcytosine-specific restriction endonuclease McrA
MNKVLRLNASGMPSSWISFEDAAVLYCKEQVLWEMGSESLCMRGGTTRSGVQSRIDMAPVIATVGTGKVVSLNSFTNVMLFRRDNYHCLYCGQPFSYSQLTRDHVHPQGQGGHNGWTNLVAACKRCNHSKGNRTPEQSRMPLLAVPFTPNPFEAMYLSQHTILGDQMDYLKKQFTGRRQWVAA